MTFKLRLRPARDCTVSYPDLHMLYPQDYTKPEKGDDPQTFYVGNYDVAVSFLRDAQKATGDRIAEAYNAWHARFSDEIDECIKSWEHIYKALRGILGLDFE